MFSILLQNKHRNVRAKDFFVTDFAQLNIQKIQHIISENPKFVFWEKHCFQKALWNFNIFNYEKENVLFIYFRKYN